MTKRTERKPQSQSFLSKMWNEFLFAREFEYETPLTPDEMADALRQIEDKEIRAWFLSARPLVHRASVERDGDKANSFQIELESIDRNKWWETNAAMQVAEGTMTANPDTGMTVVKGRTKFTGRYYAVFLGLFTLNLLFQIADGDTLFQVVWVSILVLFWYTMYRERNKFADRIDDIIMNAKASASRANLADVDEENTTFDTEISQAQQYLRD